MKKKLMALLLAVTVSVPLMACGGSQAGQTSEGASSAADETGEAVAEAAESTSELTDGKFAETQHITVEVWDDGSQGSETSHETNKFNKYIKDQMLEQHNVDVEFVAVPRSNETEQINNLLAAGSAPDICYTFDYATIQTYADMGGVADLSEAVEKYKADLPNMWDWLGETNIYWDQDPTTGSLWALEGKMAVNNRELSFIREDWLKKLGLEVPTTTEEFYQTIVAFRDNADVLLGKDADKMIPFSVSYDVGWRAAMLIGSCLDPDVTDKEYYVKGFDDRLLTQNGTKEAIKLLNQWYNEDLMWDDFALYTSGDTTEDDMIKAGYVGAFTHIWDMPYRGGADSYQANLKKHVGEDAAYIPVDCFEDKNGNYTKWSISQTDRHIFFPATNDNLLASLLYIDFISDPATIEYLQIGDEGVNHKVNEEGAVETLTATGDDKQISGQNYYLTITVNGMKLQDADATVKAIAYNYPEIDPSYVEQAYKLADTDKRVNKNAKCGSISAENGMGTTLSSKRDVLLDTAMSCPVDQFESTWENGMNDYLSAGGQAIQDERKQAWNNLYGDAEMLPE